MSNVLNTRWHKPHAYLVLVYPSVIVDPVLKNGSELPGTISRLDIVTSSSLLRRRQRAEDPQRGHLNFILIAEQNRAPRVRSTLFPFLEVVDQLRNRIPELGQLTEQLLGIFTEHDLIFQGELGFVELRLDGAPRFWHSNQECNCGFRNTGS